MNTNDFFLKKEGKMLMFFGNKTKGGNKYALQSGIDRYTAKNYITTSILPLIIFFFSVVNRLFKNMNNYQFI